jgi:hypothetical protein
LVPLKASGQPDGCVVGMGRDVRARGEPAHPNNFLELQRILINV